MLKAIIIGGAPMIGKSTIAIELASKYKFACISTDDVGESIRAQTDDDILNPMKGFDYREYYILKTKEQLILETEKQHSANWPSVLAVLNAHLNWGKPVVFEGWNFYPKWVNDIKDSDKIESIWFIANEALLKDRISNNKTFFLGASNPDIMIKKFLQRSIWYNNKIYQQAKDCNFKVIEIAQDMTIEEILSQCNGHLTVSLA